jgi:hypothetical protein
MIMNIILPTVVVVMLVAYFLSPDVSCWLAKRISKSGMQMIIAAMGSVGSVGFAFLAYLMSKNPEVNPWEILIMVVVFILMATMGIFSLAFIATIPEQMEKEK